MAVQVVHKYTHEDWQREHGDKDSGETGTCLKTARVLDMALDAVAGIGPSLTMRREMTQCRDLAAELGAEGLQIRDRYDRAYADLNAAVTRAGGDVAQDQHYHRA